MLELVEMVPEHVEGQHDFSVMTRSVSSSTAKHSTKFCALPCFLCALKNRSLSLSKAACRRQRVEGKHCALREKHCETLCFLNLFISKFRNFKIFPNSGFSVKLISQNFVRGNRSPSLPPPSRRSFEKKSTYHYGFSTCF